MFSITPTTSTENHNLTAVIATLFIVAFLIGTGLNITYAQSASISGLGEINYRYTTPGTDQDKSSSGFSIEDVMMFVKGSSGEDVDFFSEFFINPNSADDHIETAHDQSIVVERLYVSSPTLIPEHTVKAGIFHVFDGTIQSYHSATGNPLPGDLLVYRNPWVGHHGPRTLHDIFHEIGVSISGMQLPIMYTASVFNGLGERTPSDNQFDHAKISGAFGKVMYISQFLSGFRAGVSYYYGKGLKTKTSTSDDHNGGSFIGPEVAPVNRHWVGELIYKKPSIQFTGLYLQGVQTRPITQSMHENFGLEYGSFDHKGKSVMGEVVYSFTDDFDAIGRYQAIWPNDREGTNFIGAGTQISHDHIENRGALTQVEFGVKYSLTSRFSVKASWQGNYAEKTDHVGNVLWGQLVAAF